MMRNINWLRELVPAINELGLSKEEHTFWISFRRVKMKLPPDSVFHFRKQKEGLIVVSPESQIVLKLFLSPEYAPLLDEEIGTLKKLSTTRFKDYVPKVLGDGKIGVSGRWLKMDYHPGREISDLQKDMRAILEPMAILHKDTGTAYSLTDWLNGAFKRAESFPSRPEMQKLLRDIEREGKNFPDYTVVEALIHHDIHAGNVLMGEHNHPVFIDWEGEIKSLTLIDYLDFGRRQMKKDLDFRRDPYVLYSEVMARDFQISLAPESLRLAYLIYAAERSLLLFEKRKVNRLADSSGLEARILKSIE